MQRFTALFSLFCLFSICGCGSDESTVSQLESQGVQVSRGTDGNPKVVRFNDLKATSDHLNTVAQLSTLEELYASAPEANDDVLTALSQSDSLSVIEIADSEVTEKGVAAVAGMQTLKTLSLANASGVNDAAAKALENSTSLRTLNLNGTAITDEAVDSLVKIKNLEALSLAGTSLTDAGASGLIAGLPDLKTLELGSKQISDETVRNISTLASLETLTLSGSSVSGQALDALSGLAKLRYLSLADCPDVDDEGVAKLAACAELAYLDLSGSKFSGATVGKGGFAKLSKLVADRTAVTKDTLANFKGFSSLYSVSVLGTPVTIEEVRVHFASNHQTGFTVDNR